MLCLLPRCPKEEGRRRGVPLPWLLNTGDWQSQPPPLQWHKPSPPDLLFLTLEHSPGVRGGVRPGQAWGNRMPLRDHTVNTADDSSSFSLHSNLHCCSSPIHPTDWWKQIWMQGRPVLKGTESGWCTVRWLYEQGQCIQTDLRNTRHFFVVLWGRLQAWDLSKDPPPQRLWVFSLFPTSK